MNVPKILFLVLNKLVPVTFSNNVCKILLQYTENKSSELEQNYVLKFMVQQLNIFLLPNFNLELLLFLPSSYASKSKRDK